MTQPAALQHDAADLDVVPDPDGKAAGIAVASLHRARTAEHEEMWAQLFVDGVFEDVKRAVYIDGKADGSFVARFVVPNVYSDGASHRAQVRFVRAVSRIVPRGTADKFGSAMVQTPEAIADADFFTAAARR